MDGTSKGVEEPLIKVMVYLVPYVRARGRAEFEQVWIFLERNGTHLMEFATEEDARSCAEECGLPTKFQKRKGHSDLLFTEMSPTDTQAAGFYCWNEITPGATPFKEVWRPFLWSHKPELGTNQALSAIQVAPNLTVRNLIELILGA